jgi:hypothetical protein
LNRCEQFFRIQGTEDANKVFLASFYMTGDAAQWFTLVEKNRGTPTWAEFDKLVHQRFGPPLRGNALGELVQLQRETTVADYQSSSWPSSHTVLTSSRNIRSTSSPTGCATY